MGGQRKIVNTSTKEELSNALFHKKQRQNTAKGVEAIVLLEPLVVLEKRGHKIEEGKLTVGLDNKKVHRRIVNETYKISSNMQDARAKIIVMKENVEKN